MLLRICLVVVLLALEPAVSFAQLTGRTEQDARTVLQAGLSEGEPDARRELAVALSLISSRDSSARLLETLAHDKDHLVRAAAVTSLGELGDKTKVPFVKSALDDTVPEVVFAAARALHKLDPAEGRPVLLSILEKETAVKSSFVRGQLRTLLRRMKTPKSALVFAVQQGVGFVPLPGVGEGVSAMTSMLLDVDFSARAYALTVLASERQHDQLTKIVVDSLRDEDWSVRASAVQAIASWRQPALRRELAQLLSDRNRKVRYRAAAAYLRLEYLAEHPRGNVAPR